MAILQENYCLSEIPNNLCRYMHHKQYLTPFHRNMPNNVCMLIMVNFLGIKEEADQQAANLQAQIDSLTVSLNSKSFYRSQIVALLNMFCLNICLLRSLQIRPYGTFTTTEFLLKLPSRFSTEKHRQKFVRYSFACYHKSFRQGCRQAAGGQ